MKNILCVMAGLWFLIGPARAEVYQKIVAKVGSEIITSFDLDEALEFLKAQMSPEEAASAEGRQKLEEARKTLLDKMIEQKLVVQAARKWDEEAKDKGEGKAVARPNPYVPRADEVDEAVEKEFGRISSGFPTSEAFRDELDSEHLSEEAFKARLREGVLSKLTFDRMHKAKEKEFQGTFVVGDDEVKKFYTDHKSQFSTGDEVQLRNLLLPDEPKSQEKIKDLKKRVQAGEDFADLAKRYSKDEAASKGGMLGWIERGQLKWQALEDAAFKAKVGEVTGPIKTSRGWHLILVEDTRQSAQKNFEQVKPQVMNFLYAQKMRERIDNWVKELRQKTYVEIVP
jgi:hypothetical protein